MTDRAELIARLKAEKASEWYARTSDIRAYLAQLHSQHQAELAAAREQGRREALQGVPELAIEAVADFVVVNISQHTNADFRKRAIEGVRFLRALIESARDAQEKT